jgi:hypothetical protein
MVTMQPRDLLLSLLVGVILLAGAAAGVIASGGIA